MEGRPSYRQEVKECGRQDRTAAARADAVILVVLLVLLILLSSTAIATASALRAPEGSASSSATLHGVAPNIELSSAANSVGSTDSIQESSTLAACHLEERPFASAYNPSNGYVYLTISDDVGGKILILSSSCNIVTTITIENAGGIPGLLMGDGYDPASNEILAVDSDGQGFIVNGLALAATFDIYQGGNEFPAPYATAWDPGIGAMLIADNVYGLDTVRLTLHDGITSVDETTEVSAAEFANKPTAVFVTNGYVFCGGINLEALDASTLKLLGDFPKLGNFGANSWTEFAFDPLTKTVVAARSGISPGLAFLDVRGIATGKFSSSFWRPHEADILYGGAGGVTYSPSTHDLYVTASVGNDVWIIDPSGAFTHLYLGHGVNLDQLTYNPSDQDVYVSGVLYNSESGTSNATLFVIR